MVFAEWNSAKFSKTRRSSLHRAKKGAGRTAFFSGGGNAVRPCTKYNIFMFLLKLRTVPMVFMPLLFVERRYILLRWFLKHVYHHVLTGCFGVMLIRWFTVRILNIAILCATLMRLDVVWPFHILRWCVSSGGAVSSETRMIEFGMSRRVTNKWIGFLLFAALSHDSYYYSRPSPFL